MDWLKIVRFFEFKVSTTIRYKEYIDQVKVHYVHNETFGNEYLQVYYKIRLKDTVADLPDEDQSQILKAFSAEAYITFPIHTRETRFSEIDSFRLLEFSTIYSCVSSYAVLQLERHLSGDASIQVSGVDDWPILNYSKKFLDYLLQYYGRYSRLIDSRFGQDVSQFEALQELSLKSKNEFIAAKKDFSLTDEYLVQEYSFQYYQLRRLLIDNQVPIKVEGRKTVNKVHINIHHFIKAVAKEVEHWRNRHPMFGPYDELNLYEELLEDILASHLPDLKKELILVQNRKFVDNLPYGPKDLIQLIDGRIVVVDGLSLDKVGSLEIKYSILKNNLEVGGRSRTVKAEKCEYYIELRHLLQYKRQNVIKRLAPFKNWIKKRRTKIEHFTFKVDYADAVNK